MFLVDSLDYLAKVGTFPDSNERLYGAVLVTKATGDMLEVALVNFFPESDSYVVMESTDIPRTSSPKHLGLGIEQDTLFILLLESDKFKLETEDLPNNTRLYEFRMDTRNSNQRFSVLLDKTTLAWEDNGSSYVTIKL